MTKRYAAALERVFAGEIRGAPAKLGEKVAAELERDGMVERAAVAFYGSGRSALDRMPVYARGWMLTHRGRIAYCEWASEQHQEAQP